MPFYAVNEKQQQTSKRLRTDRYDHLRLNKMEKIEIRVADNGNGIPQKK